MSHSIIAPSSAFRWVPCPGSVLLEACFPNEKTEASTEGDLAHEVAAEMLRTCLKMGTRPADHRSHFGEHSDETFDGVALYVEDVLRVARSTHTFVVHIEEPVKCHRVHAESFGTPDAWLFDVASKTLHVWDFKFGRLKVEAFENWQLVNYIAGILDEVGDDRLVKVEIAIVQPRNYEPGAPVRRWSTAVGALCDMFADLRTSAEDALGDAPTVATGPHCRYCRGRHDCEAARRVALVEFEHHGEPLPQGMTLEQLGRELELLERAAEAVAYRKTGVEAALEAAIRKGDPVPGWTLKEGRGSTVWTVDVETLAVLGNTHGVTLTTPKALTPNQATKAGLPADVVATMTERKPGKLALAREELTEARRVFGGTKPQEIKP